jgi:hypothetical protein
MNERKNGGKIVVLAVLIVSLMLGMCFHAMGTSGAEKASGSVSRVPHSAMVSLADSPSIAGYKPGGELCKMTPVGTLTSLPGPHPVATDVSEYFITSTGSAVKLPGGTDIEQTPSIAIAQSGKLWAVWEAWNTGDSTWDLIVANSTDSGATWAAASIAWTGTHANPRMPHIYISKNGSTDMYWMTYVAPDPTTPGLGWASSTNPETGWLGGGGLNFNPGFQPFKPMIAAVKNATTSTVVTCMRLFDSNGGTWTTNVMWNYKDNKGTSMDDWPGVGFKADAVTDRYSTNVAVTTTMNPVQRNIIYWPIENYNRTSGDYDIWTIVGTAASSAGKASWADWIYLNAYVSLTDADKNPFAAASGANGYFFVQRGDTIVISHSSDDGVTFNDPPETVASAGKIPAAFANQNSGSNAQVVWVDGHDIYHKATTDSGTTWNPTTWSGKVNDQAGTVNSAVGSVYIHVDESNTPRIVWDDSRDCLAAPTIVSVDPADSSTGVAIDKQVVVTFSKTMDIYSVKFTCTPDPGGWSFDWSLADTVLTLKHANNFAESTLYTCSITSGTDTFGQPLGTLPYNWAFTTTGPANIPSVVFDVPVSSTKWPVGSAQDIKFTITGGTSPFVYWINYSSTGGTTWGPIAGAQGGSGINGQNTYNWNPIPPPTTMQAKLKVQILDNAGQKCYVESQQFEITTGSGDNPPTVAVTSPNGAENWNTGTVHDITWTATDDNTFPAACVNISYAPDGVSYTPIANGETQDGTYSWTVPTIATTTNAKVKVEVFDSIGQSSNDASDNAFTITNGGGDSPPTVTITSPNGGENWTVATAPDITWTATDDNAFPSACVNLSYTTDGSTWTPIANGEMNDGTYPWTVPSDPSKTVKVKAEIFDSKGQSNSDQSNADFEIYYGGGALPPSVSVTGPTAGKVWYIGNSYAINWTINGGTAPYTCFVNYSTNGGSSFSVVTQKTGAKGANSYTWAVPASATPSTTCKIRVDVVAGGKATHTSAQFTIAQKAGTLPAPTTLAATGGDMIVKLTWDSVSKATGYRIYRHNSTVTTFEVIGTATTTNYDDVIVINGETYTYYVTAMNGSLESLQSNEVSATPNKPSGPTGGGGDNTMLYAAIGAIIVVVVVVLLVALLLMKKKKQPEPMGGVQPYGAQPYGAMQQPSYGPAPQPMGPAPGPAPYGPEPYPSQGYPPQGYPPQGYPPQQGYGAPPPQYGYGPQQPAGYPPQGMPCPRCGNMNAPGTFACAFCGVQMQ